jgi:hypothetical protein
MEEPFDIFKEAAAITGTDDQFLEFLESYFHICKNKTVLEIGPLNGYHTKKIIKNTPAYVEVIEGFEPVITELKNIPGIDKVVFGDALDVLTSVKNFDVVVCMGVLYHLHSPLHLIELIVNNCTPEYLILDCVSEQQHISVLPESLNIPGSCQTKKNWKSSGVNIVLPFLVYKECLENMGYELIRTHRLQISNVSKNNSWLATWKLKENYDKSIS